MTASPPKAFRVFRVFVCFVVMLAGATAGTALAQSTHILVVTGVPGDQEHAQKFDSWAKAFIDAAKKKDAVPDSSIVYLSDKQATKPAVEKAIGDFAAASKANDTVVILLIGHGSFDGSTAAFNLMGPDLTAADYGKLLGRFSSQKVVFINTSSSSGAFLPAVSGPGRVIITATKTGGERNETEFGQYFTAAFGDEAADRDRNGHVSMAEAFDYAKTKVTDAYKQKGTILTEHAVLDDGAEGRLASMAFLGIGRSDAALAADLSDPETKKLVDERNAIQQQIEALQIQKTSMDPAKYDAAMENLLTDLALKTKAIRDRQAKK
jgi:hypothetical protein